MSIIKTLGSKLYTKNQGKFQNIVRTAENLIYRMYIQDDWKIIQLPINPESFKITMNGTIENVSIVGIGDVAIPKTRALKTFSWNGFFMLDMLDPINNTNIIFPPIFYVKFIQKLEESKKPFKFMQNSISLVSSFFDSKNYKVLIDKFEYEDRGGEPGDIYYSITLREYRDFGINILNLDKMNLDTEGIDLSQLTENPRDFGNNLTVDKQINNFSGDIEIATLKGDNITFQKAGNWNNSNIKLLSNQNNKWEILNIDTGEKGWVSADTLTNFL